MYCRNCGNEIQTGENFCGKCGTPINDSHKRTTKKKSRKIMPIIVAVCIIGIFIGVGSLVMGKNDNSEEVSQNNDLPLLTQIKMNMG